MTGGKKVHAYGYLAPIEIEELSVWRLKQTNAGFKEATASGIVE